MIPRLVIETIEQIHILGGSTKRLGVNLIVSDAEGLQPLGRSLAPFWIDAIIVMRDRGPFASAAAEIVKQQFQGMPMTGTDQAVAHALEALGFPNGVGDLPDPYGIKDVFRLQQVLHLRQKQFIGVAILARRQRGLPENRSESFLIVACGCHDGPLRNNI